MGSVGLLNTHQHIAKASKRKRFLSMKNQNYDDVYAIYTGALGAVLEHLLPPLGW
jgi:hypothetical protein